MKSRVERFYDRFSRTFLRDYVLGNRRVERQLAFFRSALPATTRHALVVGCGSGESAAAIAEWRNVEVLAIDLSGENLRIAQALYAHPKVTYQKLDITQTPVNGTFDVILLPDVYEHIPAAVRAALHTSLASVLSDTGRILMTIPSPGKQAALARTGELQIVDENVTVQDLLALARDVGGQLVYFNLISVWETNDYVHAVIARRTDQVAPLTHTNIISAGESRQNSRSRLLDLARRGPRAVLRLRRLRALPSKPVPDDE